MFSSISLIKPFDAQNWFWFLEGDDDHVYSSKLRAVVAKDHPFYVAFLAAGNIPGATSTVEYLENEYLPVYEMSALEFMDRLTQAEQLAILEAERTDITIKLTLMYLSNGAFVSLLDPRTIQGVQMMVEKGLLTESRAAIIMKP